jgi:hypothetical protein
VGGNELFFPLGLLVLWLILPSCATVDYVPPGQGTSAEQQSALAKSLEENMKEILFDPAGKAVDLHVQVLGGFQNSLGLERYVKSLFREWVVGKGGEVGPGEFRMDVFLPVLGTTATRRDLSYQNIPLYYSERFQTTARLIVMVRDAEGNMVCLWQGKQSGADLTDIYLMRIFGPFDVPLPGR